jgi:L-fuconolactonase
MDRRSNRRRFLKHSATLVTLAGSADLRPIGAASPARAAAELRDDPEPVKKGPSIPIVDTHQHLWDLSRFRLPWLKGDAKLDRSFVMDDYRKATEGLNVVKTVYMEVDVEPSQQLAEAEYVTAICRSGDTPMAGAVISGRPASDEFAGYLGRFEGIPQIKGLRQVLHGGSTPAGYCLDERFVRGIRLLGNRGLSFDLCMRPEELDDAAKLLDACPDTSFVLDHCGNASVRSRDLSSWRAGIARVAERKNVVCKVSGIVASVGPGAWSPDDLAPIVDHVLTVFGPDRVVFGGDWPVCTLTATYRQWVEALQAIVSHRSDVDRRKLFHDNAVRVYRLS